MHLERLDGLIECVATSMYTDEECGAQRQTLFRRLFERYMRRAVADLLKEAWEVVKNAHAPELSIEGMGDEVGRAVRWISKNVGTVALRL